MGRDSVGRVGPGDWDMGTVGSRPLEERNPGFGLVPVQWAPKLLALLFAFCVLVGPAAIPARGRPIATRAGACALRTHPLHICILNTTFPPSFLPSFQAPQLRTRNTHGANVTNITLP